MGRGERDGIRGDMRREEGWEEGGMREGRIVLIMGSSKGEGWDGQDRQDFSITKGRLSVRRGRPFHTPAASSPSLTLLD